ncbi:MAG: phosphomannomutase/phosphoglucomutase [Nitrospirota bacterium]
MINENIFREYDIRGIAGKDLTRELAFDLGRAFASLLKKANNNAKIVSVGRDARLSSEMLASNIIKGISAAGIDVLDIGLCPTPLQYFSIHHLNLDGGIMVTGSHNPPEYNGFKVSVGKDTIHGSDIQRLKDIIINQEWTISTGEGKVQTYNITGVYRNYMQDEFSYLNDSRFKRTKIVVDAGNGTGGIVAPGILEAMGCEVIPLYCNPDGNFPNHHPDPTVVEYIHDLIDKAKAEKADIGIGYDGDADRIGVVDCSGNIIWGDQVMIILSRDILAKKPDAVIIGDVKCSQTMFDDIEKRGGKPVMWKTGHSLVKDKMKKEGALLAGEFSGHIFIADRYYGYDDAIYATLRLVEIIKNTGKDIRELLSDVPKLHYTPEIRIGCPEDRKRDTVEKVVARFREYSSNDNSPHSIRSLDTTDGVRVVFQRGWGLIRMSNTQPVIVMRVEAESQEHLDRYRKFLEEELRKAYAGTKTG